VRLYLGGGMRGWTRGARVDAGERCTLLEALPSLFTFCMGDAGEQRPALIGSLGSEYIANALSTHKSLEAAIADVHARGALNHPRRCVITLPRTAGRRDHDLREHLRVLHRRPMCSAAGGTVPELGVYRSWASLLAGLVLVRTLADASHGSCHREVRE
jgi:hypothetical protein